LADPGASRSRGALRHQLRASMDYQPPAARGLVIADPQPRFWRLLLAGLVFVATLQAASRDRVTGALAASLESCFPRAPIGEAAAITGIVVLGGGHERLQEAGRLARKHGHLRIFVSGAGDIGRIRHHLGRDIAPDRIEKEDRSRSTFENALYTKASIQPRPGERWLLVTSATHMPRAIGAFRSQGFDIEPWPVPDLPADIDDAASILQHEVLGLLWYRLLGRTNALLPGP
jgi:uncharacterized SAM-binding protein YcdF (DUF218 family)